MTSAKNLGVTFSKEVAIWIAISTMLDKAR